MSADIEGPIRVSFGIMRIDHEPAYVACLKRHACHGQRSASLWSCSASQCSAREAGTGAKAIDAAFDARPDLARRL